MWPLTDDHENAAANKIQEILERIQDHNASMGKKSSLYEQLEDALNEYTTIRNKKKKTIGENVFPLSGQ